MAENYENIDDTDLTDSDRQPTELGFEIISWETPEYHKHDRSRLWYILYGIAGLGMLIYAVVTSNFLFAVILVVGSLVLILSDARHPEPIVVVITTEGVVVGNKFYDYDELQHFAIVYKPIDDLKRVYFEFKSVLRHRLSLPLHDTDPLIVRDNLIKYLPEDIERTNEPLSETLSRLLRL